MFTGSFKASIFFKTLAIAISSVVTLIYWISQQLNHEERITWISSCAGHYPQFLFFRIATISGAVFVILGWMNNHFYLRTVCLEQGFPIQKYQPQAMMIMGMMAGMFITISTATIDTGIRESKLHSLHTFCAAGFFLFTLIATIYNTVLFWIIQLKTEVMNRTLLIAKTAVTALILVQLVIDSYAVEQVQNDQRVGSTLGIILEWTATYTVCAYFYLMGKDVQHFELNYELLPSQHSQL